VEAIAFPAPSPQRDRAPDELAAGTPRKLRNDLIALLGERRSNTVLRRPECQRSIAEAVFETVPDDQYSDVMKCPLLTQSGHCPVSHKSPQLRAQCCEAGIDWRAAR
jgi:hypothetical protein